MRGVMVGQDAFRAFLLVTAVVATTAAGGTAAAQAGWKKGNCVIRDVSLPGDLNSLASIAKECDDAGTDRRADLDKLSNAAYNAARAYNGVGELSSGDAALVAHSAALDRVGKSVLLIPNNDSALSSEPNKQKKLANDRFRLGRAYERARALVGLGPNPPVPQQVQPGQQPSTRPCAASSRENCFSEAIVVLNESDALAAPFANPPPDPRFDDFIFLRGKALAYSGTDSGGAISALERVVADWMRSGQAAQAGKANAILADVSRKAGEAAIADKTNSGQTTARGFFQKAVAANPALVKAQLGLGDSNLWLGENTAAKRESFSAAASAYAAAVAPGAIASATGEDKAHAYEGQGKSLLALSLIPGIPDAASYRTSAIAAYNESIKLQPGAAAPRLALARAYLDASQLDQADKAFEDAINLMSPDSADRSAVLLELATKVKKARKANPAEIRATYERAKAGSRNSARPDFEIGMSFMEEGNLERAADSFRSAIEVAGGKDKPPAAGEAEVKANAYYNLSRINAQKGAMIDAVNNADAALKWGTSKPPYRDHACLAHVVRGGVSVISADSASVCSDNDQPQGLLLLGMFNLRKAQSATFSAQTKASTREMAIFTFNQGVKELARPGSPPELASVKFDWPGMPASAVPPLKNLLEFGKAVAAGCSSTVGVPLALSEQEQAAAMAFYKFYQVFDCR